MDNEMGTEILAEMEAVINQIFFVDGSSVKEGDVLMNLDVCKMLVPVHATIEGIAMYMVEQGDYVRQGSVLVRID